MSSNATPNTSNPARNHKKSPCVLCQRRKIKCDRNEPCADCIRAGVECVPASCLPPRKRKRRFPEAELLARIRRYEHHLKTLGADIDAINRGDAGPTASPIIKSDPYMHTLSPEPHAAGSLSVRRSLRHLENNLNLTVSDEFRDAEELLQGSSEDERTGEALDGGSELLLGPQATEGQAVPHPSPVQIFRLWQTFLDNVNPLIKVFHAPSVQQTILDATTNLEEIPKNIEALMFGIYAAALISMQEDECQKLFNESIEIVLFRFQAGARRALHRAGYMISSDIIVLQAFTLYLLSNLKMSINPRALFCLTGVAVRIAQRMGLNTDGTSYALPPFEAEMRRRLWWQLIHLDNRVAEFSGAGTSMLNYTWTTKIPANVNDSDLFIDMRDPPIERPGLTEMVSVRLRCEIFLFFRQSRANQDPLPVEEEKFREFEQRIDCEYLNYCDPLVPLHLVSSMMAKTALCKLRMGLQHSHFFHITNQAVATSQAQKDKIFNIALRILQIHNEVLRNASVHRYIWYIHTHFPFPALLYLLCALRHRPVGAHVDDAWQQLSESMEMRSKLDTKNFFGKKRSSLLRGAMANLAVKAWDAREAAAQRPALSLPTPKFVLEYKKVLGERQPNAQPPANATAPMPPAGQPWLSQTPQLSVPDSDSLSLGPEFDESMLPAMGSADLEPNSWEFWNGMIQGDPVRGIDESSNFYYYAS